MSELLILLLHFTRVLELQSRQHFLILLPRIILLSPELLLIISERFVLLVLPQPGPVPIKIRIFDFLLILLGQLGQIFLLFLVMLDFLLIILHHFHHLVAVALGRGELFFQGAVQIGLLIQISLEVNEAILVLTVNSFDSLKFL